MSNAISKNRHAYKQKNTVVTKAYIEQVKEHAVDEAVSRLQKLYVSAMLLAMNSELGIGTTRALKVINEMNNLINKVANGEITQDKLNKMAENKLKFERKVG